MAIHQLIPAGTLKAGEVKPFHLEGKYLLLVQGEDGPALVSGICPHAGADLATGTVVGNRIRCQTHRYFFDLANGSCAAGRREGWGPLPVYSLQEVNGYLCTEL